MEAANLTLRGPDADRFASAFVEAKAEETRRSFNKRGVRNIHRYRGDGFTHVAYERGSAHENSWVVVSLLVEPVDEETATVVVQVGGGGEGPFKLEEISPRRLLEGEEAVGQAGRFATVLEDVESVCSDLELSVETEWESETEQDVARTLQRKIFDS
ncbi:hypothetical protein [Haloarcula litorea]|uniref:hypothetical protein n=1 Tax=Haloarcula litorea TaxID=3032579 RepID=UPI0023E7D55E|nr:hypothetical protein [Halomicroarcula sp. GDY20]